MIELQQENVLGERRAGSAAPSGRRRRVRPHVLALGLLALLAGCRIPAPTVRQGLDYGFRTPEQTFRSWRTAVQGRLLVEEYRTLSKGYKARNGGLSLFTYSEARDGLLAALPQLEWLLYRAKEPEVVARGERAVVLQSRIPGPLWFDDQWLVVHLVREGFWDVWVDSQPYQPFDGRVVEDVVEAQNLYYAETSGRDSKGPPLLYGIVAVERDGAAWPEDVSLLQVGWEWKIDAFETLPAPLAADRPAPAPAP